MDGFKAGRVHLWRLKKSLKKLANNNLRILLTDRKTEASMGEVIILFGDVVLVGTW